MRSFSKNSVFCRKNLTFDNTNAKTVVKPKLLLFSLLLLCTLARGQEVVFNARSWDFGPLKEADGPVAHDFAFRNSGDRPLRIGSVSVSCSCVQATFPHSEIPAGGTGVISLTFSPAGAAGKTHRYADVYSQEGKYLGRLSMEAVVEPIDVALEERYRTVLSPVLRSRRSILPFGYVWPGKPAQKEVYLANLSDHAVQLRAQSEALQVEGPSEIPPRGEVILKVSYNPSKAYRMYHDQLRFFIDGEPAGRPIEVSAICLGDVAPASSSVWISPSTGRLQRGRGSVMMGNSGKEDLVVLAVEAPDGVKHNLHPGQRIAPGGKLRVRVSSALQTFEIHIFTNDPLRPYKELRFTL